MINKNNSKKSDIFLIGTLFFILPFLFQVLGMVPGIGFLFIWIGSELISFEDKIFNALPLYGRWIAKFPDKSILFMLILHILLSFLISIILVKLFSKKFKNNKL